MDAKIKSNMRLKVEGEHDVLRTVDVKVKEESASMAKIFKRPESGQPN